MNTSEAALTHLDVSDNELNDDAIEVLADMLEFSTHFCKLRTLVIEDEDNVDVFYTPRLTAALNVATHLSELRSLTLGYTIRDNIPSLAAALSAAHFSKLEELSVGVSMITSTQLTLLANAIQHLDLKRLHILNLLSPNYTGNIDDGALALTRVLRGMPKLKEVHLTGMAVTADAKSRMAIDFFNMPNVRGRIEY